MSFAASQGSYSLDFVSKCSLTLPNSTGYATHSGKSFLYRGMSRGALLLPYSLDRSYILSNELLKNSHSSSSRIVSVVCSAGPNNYRRNPDFSRKGGTSRGKSKQHHEREDSENSEEADFISSKNGSLLSLSSNPRYQATAVPGRREKEIVELFRKVQAQLRERAAVKEEKKIEAAQQGQNERGTVDSLLKLLRKHSVDQKKSGNEDDLNLDHAERSTFFEDEQNLNPLKTNNIKSDSVQEPSLSPSTRPVSNFIKRSPVPRVKFQPVFTAEDDTNSTTVKSQGKVKKNVNKEAKRIEDPKPLMLDDQEDVAVDDHLDQSDSDEAKEDAVESSETEGSSQLGSLKLSELRDLAKSRGIKGYSKLKKSELVELLSV